MIFLCITGVLFKETGVTMLFSCATLDILYNTNIMTGVGKRSDWREIRWTRIVILAVSGLLYIASRLLMGTPQFHLEDNPIAVIENHVFRVSLIKCKK